MFSLLILAQIKVQRSVCCYAQTGSNVVKHFFGQFTFFTVVSYSVCHCQTLSPMSNIWCSPLERACLEISLWNILLSYMTNNGLEWRCLTVTNTLAFRSKVRNNKKYFFYKIRVLWPAAHPPPSQNSRANVIKLFVVISYKFSYLAKSVCPCQAFTA